MLEIGIAAEFVIVREILLFWSEVEWKEYGESKSKSVVFWALSLIGRRHLFGGHYWALDNSHCLRRPPGHQLRNAPVTQILSWLARNSFWAMTDSRNRTTHCKSQARGNYQASGWAQKNRNAKYLVALASGNCSQIQAPKSHFQSAAGVDPLILFSQQVLPSSCWNCQPQIMNKWIGEQRR